MAQSRRVDLSRIQEGAWAEVRTSAPYGMAREAQALPAEERGSRLDVMLRWMVSAWSLCDVDGHALGAPRALTQEQWDLVPTDAVAAILAATAQSAPAPETPDPNVSGAASSGS